MDDSKLLLIKNKFYLKVEHWEKKHQMLAHQFGILSAAH